MKTLTERLSNRINGLGTETAFAVSNEAAEFVAAGNKVYPFHLGDMNLPTPPNIIEATHKAIADGKTGYCSNYGVIELRAALADDINASHKTEYITKNVVIQPGGKPVIGKFLLSIMNPGDGVLYPNPGYPIYESQIEFHGGIAQPYTYIENSNGFKLDFDSLEAVITPETRILILNNLQNPTGAECSLDELIKLDDIAVKHDLFVLSDEAYFDIHYGAKAYSIVSIEGLAERSLILYTFSKKFAMTGWRLGAAVGPKWLVDTIAKLNVNDESCSNHFIQYGALEGLTGDQTYTRKILDTLKQRRNLAVEILNSIEGIHCYLPNATFYLFPNVTKLMRNKNITSYEDFRRTLLKETGVSVCTRLHFGRRLEQEEEYYIRLAYSGIDCDEITEGLSKFKQFAETI